MKKFIILVFLTENKIEYFRTTTYIKDSLIKVSTIPFYVVDTIGDYSWGYKANWLGKILL